MDVAGKHFGVVDLGGLGHMAIKFGKAFGMTVTVFSTSPSQWKDALEVLGADWIIVNKDPEQMKVIFLKKNPKEFPHEQWLKLFLLAKALPVDA